MAKTPECIFTPAGMPRMGRLPALLATSRAVPSPPQNRIKSTPFSRKAWHAALLSRGAGVLRSLVNYLVMQATIREGFFAHLSAGDKEEARLPEKQMQARSCALGCQRLCALALAIPARPSVPFRPTAPPIPAMGLMRKPIFPTLATIKPWAAW